MGPQIWHVGAVKSFQTGWEQDGMESPSGPVAPGTPRGKVMTEVDVAATIDAYAKAAAKRLGFDVVELHGGPRLPHRPVLLGADQHAHGPLRRCHAEGAGTLRGLAAEVVRAVRAAVGPRFPIILRLSQ